MAFRVEVPASFVFADNEIILAVNGTKLDLNKIETLEDWRLTLYAIASQALAGIVKPSQPTEQQPTSEQQKGPVASAAEAMTQTGEQFQQEHYNILERTNKLREELLAQYNDLTKAHASTINDLSRGDVNTATEPEGTG